MESKPAMTPEQEDRMIEEAFREVLDGYLKSNHRKKVEIIERAYHFAKEAHKGIRRRSGEPYILHPIAVAKIASLEIGLGSTSICAALLHDVVEDTEYTVEDIEQHFGKKIAQLVEGLTKISGGIFGDKASLQAENFRKLLLTMSEDIRVVLIKMADRLHNMRTLGSMAPNKQYKIAGETLYIYAPLAHRLGLFEIKTELEDLSFKYEHPAAYARISEQIRESEARRQAVYSDFSTPIKEKLDRMGLVYEAKARLKSVYSIWNKMVKQQTDVNGIYDLFAIRIILDVEPVRERAECWLAFSVITDMFQPNPARMKDWLSVPKSNGYESLHITVLGPEDKWVEVQIRSRRMDEIAETGLAAHWKYKGIKSENELDMWMNHVRDILEDAESGPTELMRNMKMDLYNKEVFVFTPRGDLYKLPLGSTILDFAFNIHSSLGCICTGGRVNGKNRKINHKLHSGDTVEIITSASQSPKLDWLSFVVTSKARSKIRQALKEKENRDAELAKEMVARRFKNRKIEIEEGIFMRMIKKLGFKTVTEFYSAVASNDLDVNDLVVEYEAVQKKEEAVSERVSAEEFTMQQVADPTRDSSADVLVIGDNVKGMNYRFSKCCNPIYGDDVFGFVSSEGVIKIHRRDCPNAPNIMDRYPYRVIPTRWSGRCGNEFVANISVVGTDDIGIVTNISSIINKQQGASLRNISINSNDGLFHGFLVVGVENTSILRQLISKISAVKGVKDVQRGN